MLFQKKLGYILLGGLLALGITFGGAGIFAQDDDGADEPTQTEPGDESGSEGEAETPSFPGFGNRGQRGFGQGQRPNFQDRPDLGNHQEALAEALGITVEELEAAHTAVHTAAIEQAVADGALTQEQADQLLSGELGSRGGFGGHGRFLGGDGNEALANELGITVEELEAAHAEVRATQIEALIEAGVLTQEQADMMAARQAVQSYLDVEELRETMQTAYEDAVAAALADGVITQEQADTLLENAGNGFGMGNGFGKRGNRGGPNGFRGGPNGFTPQTQPDDSASALDA